MVFSNSVSSAKLNDNGYFMNNKTHSLVSELNTQFTPCLLYTSIKPKHASAHEYLAEAYRFVGEEELAQQHQDIADSLRENRNI